MSLNNHAISSPLLSSLLSLSSLSLSHFPPCTLSPLYFPLIHAALWCAYGLERRGTSPLLLRDGECWRRESKGGKRKHLKKKDKKRSDKKIDSFFSSPLFIFLLFSFNFPLFFFLEKKERACPVPSDRLRQLCERATTLLSSSHPRQALSDV